MALKTKQLAHHHIAPVSFRQDLLLWYSRHKRQLPWRSIALDSELDIQQKAYCVWLSEIMLQQTVVQTVKPYFEKFLTRWPDVKALADAHEDEVMQAWAGLGYYSRARNLHKCAKKVAYDLGGVFPDNEEGLILLPGIGPYTAASITAIAFNKPAVVIDGNVDRIIVRLYALDEPIRDIKKDIRALSSPFYLDKEILDDKSHSDFAQAMMDLGAGVCIPKSPRCAICPVSSYCLAYKKDVAPDLPVKPVKKAKPHKYGVVFVIKDDRGRILIEKRPDKGLLASTFGFPTSDWIDIDYHSKDVTLQTHMPQLAKTLNTRNEKRLSEEITHVFTHFSLSLRINVIDLYETSLVADSMQWIEPNQIHEIGMPSLFAKVLKFAIME